MSKPVIANNHPAQVELEKGKTYFFCVCGRSDNQPFCNGAHKTTDIKPLSFTAEKSGRAFLCVCKQTGKAPYCDGTHKNFPDEAVPGRTYVTR